MRSWTYHCHNLSFATLVFSVLHFLARLHEPFFTSLISGSYMLLPFNETRDNATIKEDKSYDHPPSDASDTSSMRSESSTKPRILYIVTSLQEFDDGHSATTPGYDRFTNILVPVLRESATSMLASGHQVDLYLITHYVLTSPRYNELRTILPEKIGLQVWDDATPLGYDGKGGEETIEEITRVLARQHRLVIKDKFLHYDAFVNFEDDMLVRGAHVDHFMKVTDELYRMKLEAPSVVDPNLTMDGAGNMFYGTMTKGQLARTIPGFMRVEVALPSYEPRRTANTPVPQIDADMDWGLQKHSTSGIDPRVCCHVPDVMANEQIPSAPSKDDLLYWETSIEALSLRKMPENSTVLDWVVLQAGSRGEMYGDTKYMIGDYWTGRDERIAAGDMERPQVVVDGKYLNNQGGWMGTRRQIFSWHTRWCSGSFLPPFNNPAFEADGLKRTTVEFWSGGLQLCGFKACNLQRIITLNPDGFSRHLLYHVSNNKQRSQRAWNQFSNSSVNEFWGQLNALRKRAEVTMKMELGEVSS